MNMKTSSSTGNNVLPTFHPIPKRFMVWETNIKEWLCIPGTNIEVWGLLDLMSHKPWLMRHKFAMQIAQSTNLFDKDGKEIFEGSIINVYENHNFGNGDNERDFDGVVVCHEGCWSVYSHNGVDEIMQPLYEFLPEHITLTGHIFSNPELLEEEDSGA